MIQALLDHLWQSSLCAACIWLLALNFARNKASLRYWLWLTASLKFLVPFALIVAVGALVGENRALVAAGAELARLKPIAQPFSGAAPIVGSPTASVSYLLPLLAVLWLTGFGAMIAHYASQFMRLREAIQNSTRASATEPLEIRFSHSALEPGLIGIFRPVISLPDDIGEYLTDEEIKAVIAHELCHWRRRDNLTALLHMLIEAAFWFFPPLKWIGRRLNEERERSCDESVLAAGIAPGTYTDAILKVCKLYAPSPLSCAPGVAGANLKLRIDSIMMARFPAALTPFQKVLLAGFGALLLAIPFTAGIKATSWRNMPTLDQIASAMAEQAAPRMQVSFNASDFDAFSGYYLFGNEPDRFVMLSRKSDHFFFRFNGQIPVEIYPESKNKFFTRSVPGGFQIRFNRDIFGETTSLTVYDGGEQLGPFPKIDATAAGKLQRAFEFRLAHNIPLPLSESLLPRFIEDVRKDDFADIEMLPSSAALVRQVAPTARALLKRLGAAKSIEFTGVDPGGRDNYEVRFEHGRMLWSLVVTGGKLACIDFSELPAMRP